MRDDVLLVYKKSQLRLALENRNERIRRLLDADDVSVRAMRGAHEAHEHALARVEKALAAARCRVRRVYRARLRRDDAHAQLTICVGGDGTLLDASHKIARGVVLGVNSDVVHSVGFLCAANADSFAAVLDEVLAGTLAPTPLARLGGTVDGAPLPFPVLNEVLVAHKNPAATSRYLIGPDDALEDQKSSGVWVSTATGSTAAAVSAGGEVQDVTDVRMQLRVREPFVAGGPITRRAQFFGGDDEVAITSKMREGRVWLDGPHCEVPFPTGARLVVHGRAPPLPLIVTPAMIERRARVTLAGASSTTNP